MVRELTERELEAALAPVKGYFFGSNLSPNTVLSAYLRAAGLHPSGQTWQVAKYALEEGGSFGDAVLVAGGEVPSEVPAELPREEPTTFVESPLAATEALMEHVDAYDAIPARALSARSAHVNPTPDLPPEISLQWYPKQFGVGDLDGDGASRLLGTPDLAPVSVLVRETAQNSWDARVRGQLLDFTMNLRLLSDHEVEVLRSKVFTEDAGPIRVASRLDQGPMWVLEISDRGAKGLGGPIRNDLAVADAESTNFIDLILNIGSPRDVHLGAGTYGFGKTISYTTSQLGTVVFWSRTHHEGKLQHRVIGSAFGPSYEQAGRRFTGRHWWGVVPPGGQRVEPLVDEPARLLGENLFHRGFEELETGTNLLILDPRLGGEDREDDARSLVESCLWHLWPKLVPTSGEREQMRISIELNGVPLPLPEVDSHPVLSAFADALRSVRRAQGETADDPVHPTEVHTIEILRPRKTLGHLAVAKFPKIEWDAGARAVVPLSEPVSNVALMRHDAELLVKYMNLPALDSPSLQWCGVFKPIEATDDSFAMAEPPSHDDWVAEAVKDRSGRQVVNMALRRIREFCDRMLSPERVATESDKATASVVALADSLAPLMGPVPGSAPSRRRARSRPGGARTKKPRVRITDQVLGPSVDGTRRIAVLCCLDSTTPAHVEGRVGVAVEGGSTEMGDVPAALLGWTATRPDLTKEIQVSHEEPELQPGEEMWLVASVQEDLVADVDVRVRQEPV